MSVSWLLIIFLIIGAILLKLYSTLPNNIYAIFIYVIILIYIFSKWDNKCIEDNISDKSSICSSLYSNKYSPSLYFLNNIHRKRDLDKNDYINDHIYNMEY